MKNLFNTPIKPLLVVFPFLVLCSVAGAQSLPAKQEVNLRAPANLKIDGKANEWDNKFQAYNKNVELFYTIANDDDNLYFVVQATRPRVIEKIINVGVTVTVNSADAKDDKAADNISINFPLIDFAYVPQIVFNAGAKTKEIYYATGIGPDSRHTYKPEFEVKPSDSLKNAATKLLTDKATIIHIKGMKDVPDNELSVYNDKNIKVAMAFDHTGAYTYELAIPLKYFGLSISDAKKFSYNIKLQNRQDVGRRGMVTRYNNINGQSVSDDLDLDSSTDFWAEYTLARK